MSPNLRRLLESLKKVRRSGPGWVACCPAHEDRNPSLSIREKNARILVYCFAGCSAEAVCGAVGMTTEQLFTYPRLTTKPEPLIVRQTRKQMESLRSKLTPRDRERSVTVVLAHRDNPEPAFARALALSVEGELVQVLFREDQ